VQVQVATIDLVEAASIDLVLKPKIWTARLKTGHVVTFLASVFRAFKAAALIASAAAVDLAVIASAAAGDSAVIASAAAVDLADLAAAAVGSGAGDEN
jgi:hypothetical protein